MKVMNALIFSLAVIVLVLPLITLLGLLCYILWYTLNSNLGVSWQDKPLIAWELQNTAPNWKDMRKQSESSMENSGW